MGIKSYLTGALVSGVMALVATSASAVTYSGINDSDAEATATVDGLVLSIDFDWVSAPVTSFVEFTIDTQFDLNLTNYVGGVSDVTGYTVDVLSDTDPAVRLTQQGRFCGGAAAPVSGDCDLVGVPGGTSSQTFVSPPALLFENLAAGSYRIGMYDSGSPQVGSLSFEVAAIPLPAGLALLLGGLGVLGFTARRKA